ncbi:MAG: HAMP domain-containing sensor histidine kinase [Methylococcaceae bacterium]|nr:HAMP domain-containing sensor histidine kinase [Methylococcaceae bacterium]
MTFSKRNPKNLLDRPARLRGMALLALLSSVLAILGGMIWRNLERLDTVQAYVGYSHRIQDAGLSLQQALVDVLSGGALNATILKPIFAKIGKLATEDAHLAQDTPAKLHRVNASVSRAMSRAGDSGKGELFDALRVMHEIIDTETEQREKVLEEVSREALAELELATFTLILILLLTWLFLRRRILTPLHDLKQLLLNLAKEDFTPIGTDHLDTLLLPVFNSYNVMVTHLGELEEAKRMYAESLEAEVRSATQALLEQQRSLASAEKLAAVGELAASLAHELRNPLAGIQMSCANLRQEIDDSDQAERLDLIGAELKRMTRLLNGLLDQGKQTPPPAKVFNLASLAKELIALTHYQIPAHISLSCDIPGNLVCRLPDCSLRQALLNLILNAAQALDETPGTVNVSARQENRILCIEVNDDGPGFSEEMLANGIRAFSTGRARGTGLGLVVVQRFAREWGGRVELSNRTPHGACVRLLLPGKEAE